MTVADPSLPDTPVYEALRDALRAERPVALATVTAVADDPAAPRLGAKLLAGPEGSVVGTLGDPDLDRVVTRDALIGLQLPDHVAVYFPQSYNFAGNLLVVPRSAVEPLSVSSGELMTFIVSGGVSGMGVGAPMLTAGDGTPRADAGDAPDATSA